MKPDDCHADDGTPLKCRVCSSVEFDSTVHVTHDLGTPCEVSFACSACGEPAAYWAYGEFDPSYYKAESDSRILPI